MRLAVLLLAACATTSASRQPSRPTEEAIKRLSYEILTAVDRADHARFDQLAGPDFIHFEGGRAMERAEELAKLRKRQPGAPLIAKRTWEHERVYLRDDHALFTGKATEIQGGNDIHGGYKYVGWYTLQWVRDGDAWKARYWSWQRATEPREFWNDIYENDVGFNKQPNKLLVETARQRAPGTALDLTTGQGRNALYLASQGWKVTGVDMADQGIRVARAKEAERGLEIEMIEANIDSWDFGTARWDLVAMIYAGAKEAWLEKVKTSLEPGGVFVLEYFAYDPARGHDDGIKPGTLAKTFAGFEILRDEVVEDVPDWAMDRAKLQRFVARKP